MFDKTSILASDNGNAVTESMEWINYEDENNTK